MPPDFGGIFIKKIYNLGNDQNYLQFETITDFPPVTLLN